MIKICFCTPGISIILNKKNYLGGSEFRAFRLLKYLQSDKNLILKVIVFEKILSKDLKNVSYKLDHYRKKKNTFETIVDIFFKGKFTDSWNQVDCDIYAFFGLSKYSSDLVTWCKENNKISIFFIGSDNDINEKYKKNNNNLNVKDVRYEDCLNCLINSNHLVVQTQYQQKELDRLYNRKSLLLRNPIEKIKLLKRQRKHILWIGKDDDVKNPLLVFKIAKLFPYELFLMIINNFSKINEIPKNVKIIKFMNNIQIQKKISEAKILINTSLFEGFPNTFLEAGLQKTPIISLHSNPDNILNKLQAGYCVNGSFNKFVLKINDILNKTPRRNSSFRNYILKNHCSQQNLYNLKKLIKNINHD